MARGMPHRARTNPRLADPRQVCYSHVFDPRLGQRAAPSVVHALVRDAVRAAARQDLPHLAHLRQPPHGQRPAEQPHQRLANRKGRYHRPSPPRVPLPPHRPFPPRGSASRAPIVLLYIPCLLPLALPCSHALPFALPLSLPWPHLSPHPNLWACAQWLLLNIVVLALFFGGIGGFSSASTSTYLTENRTMAIPGIAGAEYEYGAWCAPPPPLPTYLLPSRPAPGRLASALANPRATVCAAPHPRLSVGWQWPCVRHHAGGSNAARDSGEHKALPKP